MLQRKLAKDFPKFEEAKGKKKPVKYSESLRGIMQKERIAAAKPKNSANWGAEYNNVNLMAFGDLV